MRPIYIWQYPEWPTFIWDDSRLITLLSEVRNLEGKIQGTMSRLGFDLQNRAALDVMTEDVLRSNEIEGVILNSDRVRSSIARHLGIDTAGLPQPDHYTEFPTPFFSMSAEILREKESYYDILEHTTTGSTDITAWLEWFLQTMKTALLRAEKTVEHVVQKSSFWERHREIPMNERQVKVVNMLWDGFKGKLTSSKWAKITKTSQATALRDITDLIDKGVLVAATDGGRSSNYLLKDNADTSETSL